MTNLVDVFPIYFDTDQYPLTAYNIVAENAVEVGAKFAYRVRKLRETPCAWIKGENILVVPQSFGYQDLRSMLQETWEMQLEDFGLIQDFQQQENWLPSANVLAEFVANAIFDDVKHLTKNPLGGKARTFGRVRVVRKPHLKGIVVDGTPALQITVTSPMSSTQTLMEFFESHGKNFDKIKGIDAKCKDTIGTVKEIVGNLEQHRARLKSYKPASYDATLLDTLPDEHPIVAIKPSHSRNSYHYPMQVLKIVVDMGNMSRLGLSNKEINDVTGYLKISPDNRRPIIIRIVNALSAFLKAKFGAISLGEAFNNPNLFIDSKELKYSEERRFGDRVAVVQRDTQLISTIKKGSLYRKNDTLDTMSVVVIDLVTHTVNHPLRKDRNEQLKRFMNTLSRLGTTMERAMDPIQIVEKGTTEQRNKLQKALREVVEKRPDLVILYLPDSDRQQANDDRTSLYNTAKRECIKAGIPSQVIMESNIGNNWADDNILMGILGKTGNIPYVLAHPLAYTDLVVGLDVSRRPKSNNSGTMGMAALSRVYTNEGQMLGYAVSGASVDGEIIPQHILERILPYEEFKGKRVIVHRDGRFVGRELNDLINWGKSIGAEFLPVEVVKSGVARIYKNTNGAIQQADKGTAFLLSDSSAYLVSSPPPSGRNGAFSTARPLEINSFSSLTIQEALHSVLALTLLHYGSVRSPRLPVSTHASDKIADFLTRDIRPEVTRGDVPFWL